MWKRVRTTRAWGARSAPLSAVGADFLPRVCHCRMNDRINNIFLLPVVMEDVREHTRDSWAPQSAAAGGEGLGFCSLSVMQHTTSNTNQCDKDEEEEEEGRGGVAKGKHFSLILKRALHCCAIISKAWHRFKCYRSSEGFRRLVLPGWWRGELNFAPQTYATTDN